MTEHAPDPLTAALATAPAPDVAGALRRAAARAEAEGLVDVGYAQVDSPLGRLVLAASPRGLLQIAYEDFNGGLDAVLEHLALRVSPRILEGPERLDDVRRELDEFFEGRRERFDVPLDWALTSGFTRRILQATAAIPYGTVSTYRDVAVEAGSPRATRAAGNALSCQPRPHRRALPPRAAHGGGLGGYTGGVDKKQRLLAIEGVLAG
jgi:methylated-DNA-[protein]-cysteine S-methyltransferase